jgi:hypothetical protein
MGGWRRLYSEEFRNMYYSPNIMRIFKSRSMRWEGHIRRTGGKWNAYRGLDLRETEYGGMDWINLAQKRAK